MYSGKIIYNMKGIEIGKSREHSINVYIGCILIVSLVSICNNVECVPVQSSRADRRVSIKSKILNMR